MVYPKTHERAPRTILHEIVETSTSLSPASREKYSRDLDAWIRFAGTDPNGWTRKKSQAFYAYLLNVEHLKPQSANRLMSSLKFASKWWASNEDRQDFVLYQSRPSTKSKKFVSLTPEETTALLGSCTNKAGRQSPLDLRDQTMIIVALETGMRRMSLEGMQLEAISTKPYPNVPVPLKGQREDPYPVPLSDCAMRALAPWRDWLRSKKVTRGPVFRQVERHVAPNTTIVTFNIGDTALSSTMIHKIIVRRAKLAGIHTKDRHIHPHLFRHTFSSWRRDAGIDDAHIASITGHAFKGTIGALGGYYDMQLLGGTARNTTPAWFAELVDRILR